MLPDFDRRLGARHTVPWIEIRWRFAVPNPDPALPPTVEAAPAYLVDVSVSGAGLVAPASPHVVPGTVAGIEYGDLAGTVTVRRINQFGPDAATSRYGIEFTDPNSPLTLGLCDAFLARHSQVAAWHDPRAQSDTGPAPRSSEGAGSMPAPLDASGFGFGPG